MKLNDFLKTKSVDRNASQPVYMQLASIIQEAIAQRYLSAGDRLPTTRELCEAFGLNHLTVRQAIKQLETDGHILIKPGRGGFIPSKQEKVQKILLMLPTLGDDLCAGISRGVRAVLEDDGFDIYVLDYNHDPEVEQNYLRKIYDEGYAGAILYPTLAEESTRLILQFLVEGFPIVLLDREFTGVPGWYVLSDNFQGGYLAGKHLLEQGCREMACVMSSYPNVQDRLRGFQTAIMEAGLPLRKSRICIIESDGDPLGRHTKQLLETDSGVDGIFYHNDFQALYGYKKIKEAGFSIPGKIKVVGFDDMSAARFADPELTSIHQYPEQIGRAAATMFLEQLALPAKERFQKREKVIPVKLICRESSR